MKQKTKRESDKKARRGSALLLATILLFVILSMAISLTYVTVMEQKMAQKTKSSTGAFFNAESGVEWALNKIASGSGNISDVFSGFAGGSYSCPSSDCEIYFLDEDGKVIASNALLSDVKAVRSVGTQNNETQRAIEAAVAAGGGGFYVSYGNPPAPAPSPNEKCLVGFTNKGSIGSWGLWSNHIGDSQFCPPAGNCGADTYSRGNAYL